MRSTTGTGYVITYPEALTYATAGNYVKVALTTPYNAYNIKLAFRVAGNNYITLSRYGSEVIFPIDGVFNAILADGRSSATLTVTIADGVNVTLSTLTILLGAQPYGAELSLPSADVAAEFKAPSFFPIYPNLPQKVEYFVYTNNNYYVTANGEVIGYTDVGVWRKNSTTSASVGITDAINVSEVPSTVVALAQLPVDVDQCTNGYLVSWQDPDGLRHTYRFPKGEVTVATKIEGEVYSFDDNLCPIQQNSKTATRTIRLTTDMIGKRERDYIDGLYRGSDITLLDLAEWSADSNTQPVNVVVAEADIRVGVTPYQRREVVLTYQFPTL